MFEEVTRASTFRGTDAGKMSFMPLTARRISAMSNTMRAARMGPREGDVAGATTA
jgi:hypothetical protein